jgi:predicted nucleic-acid-binding protein
MERGKHFAPADRIMKEIAEERLNGYVSASQITDVYYFLEKKYSHEKAINVIADLITSIHVIGVDRKTVEAAIESGMLDFEDAVQTVAAKDKDINIVVTRDPEGYYNSGLKIYLPEEFLETL